MFLVLILLQLIFLQVENQPRLDQPSAEASGTLKGATRDDTGKPIANARVQLSSGLTSTTDEKGNYILTRVPAGTYIIIVQKDGCVSRPRNVRLHHGEALQRIDFTLQQDASVSGRILDEDKHPVANVRVTLWAIAYQNGTKVIRARGSGRTNDQGDYGISQLPDGTYFLSADPPPHLPTKTRQPPPDRGHSTTGAVSLVRAFYPGLLDAAGAVQISLRAAEHRQSVDMVLPRRDTYCASGTLGGIPQKSEILGINVMLFEFIANGWQTIVASGPTAAHQNFEFCGLPRGSYRFIANAYDSTGGMGALATEQFSIITEDRALGVLGMQQGHEVQLRVELDGSNKDETSPLPSPIVVQLNQPDRVSFRNEGRTLNVMRSGKYSFSRVFPGEYYLDVRGLPPGYYVKQARVGPRDALQEPIHPDDGDMTILLGTNGPRLSGTLVDHDGQTISDAMAVIVPKRSSTNIVQPMAVATDQDGKFEFSGGIRPGDYRLLGIVGVTLEAATSPDLIERLLFNAQDVSLQDGDVEQRTVTVQLPR